MNTFLKFGLFARRWEKGSSRSLIVLALAAVTTVVHADTLVLKDGATLAHCFARDEGVRYLVWEKMEDVGTPRMRIIPRSHVKECKSEREASWDVHPNLPDLSVTYIEMSPKLAGLHWHVNYDELGTPVLGGGKVLLDLGAESAMKPEEAVKNLKLKHLAGEPITLTAHVKNVGFTNAGSFAYMWLIDGQAMASGKCEKSLKELEEVAFPWQWNWQEGKHTVTFKVTAAEPEVATINNEATDPLWGWGFTFVINSNRTYHDLRNACGSFCFEDYYRWHVELMNTLFAASIFPSAPDGIQARVRLDRILYCENPNDDALKLCTAPDGMGYLQGMWTWTDSPEEKQKGWPMPEPVRHATEWSLPHELAHQLGIPDWYAQDNYGVAHHLWPDNGEKVCHLMSHPLQMEHWHGPFPWGEADAGYLNLSWDKPRGYFGDFFFAIPDENFLRVVDINGWPVPEAKIEVYQRAVTVDPQGPPRQDHGVRYYPVKEGSGQGNDQSKYPVIVGVTDADGLLRLPNRPVREVRTLNGFHRKPNPFGNVDTVGPRAQMLVKVTRFDRSCYFWLELYNFNVAWFRGQKAKYTTVLKTPYRSTSSPLPPANVTATQIDEAHVKVTWNPPKVIREQQYLDRVIGYKVYRRVGCMGLDDRPWFPVATLNPDTTECLIDLKQRPADNDYYSNTERYAVSSLGELSIESELVEAPVPPVTK